MNGNSCSSSDLCEEKFRNMHEKIKQLDEKITAYDGVKEVLVELKILTSQLVKSNEQKEAVLNEHTIVLNQTMRSLCDVIELQKNQSARIDEIDDKVNNVDDKSKIDLMGLVRDIAGKAFYVGIGVLLLQLINSMPK